MAINTTTTVNSTTVSNATTSIEEGERRAASASYEDLLVQDAFRAVKFTSFVEQTKSIRERMAISIASATVVTTVTTATSENGEQVPRYRADNTREYLYADVPNWFNINPDTILQEPDQWMRRLQYITSMHHPINNMMSTPDVAKFLSMLVKVSKAEKTMEIGVFTGYTLLATALALPRDGKIVAIDINRVNYEQGLPVIENAGVAHKIDFHEAPALWVLDDLKRKKRYLESLDFAWVDADKENYGSYHQSLIEMVKVGGVICYGNLLPSPNRSEAPLEGHVPYYRNLMFEIDQAIATDPRIEVCPLAVGRGIVVCRRIL